MSNSVFFKEKKTNILASLCLAAILLLVGWLFYQRMGELLVRYTENQTRRQAETLSYQTSEKFSAELEILSYIAQKIEENPDDIEHHIPTTLGSNGVKQGLLSIDGRALYGDSMSLQTYDGIQTSFRGNNAITFVSGGGILFTCPVFHGKNIKYVLYRFYPTRSIAERFSISCYDDIGKMCVITRDGEVVVPFARTSPEDVDFIKSWEVENYYHSMHREMEVSVAVAHNFYTKRGDTMLFEAEVPNTDYLVVGFVPLEKAAEGIGNLKLLVVWVFGLLMLLVALGSAYVFYVWGKIYEGEELRHAKALAEEASKAKSGFLANMSHEIRTPINAVLGMNEMILRECQDNNILAYASSIKSAGNTLLGIINDILDFSKIEAGKLEIIPVEYDLSSVLNDLVNMVQTRADAKGLTISLDFDPNTPKNLYGDEVRIKQVITNILTNGVKYTEKGSVTFTLGFERIADNPDGVRLYVAVKDTGIGIKPEDLKKLFEKFERIEEKRNRKVEGTGLGMAITLNLLNMMGSTIQVESDYGHGTKFYFYLEQRVINWEPLGNYEAAYQALIKERNFYQEKFVAPDAQVLVVDDNQMNLMVFKSLLKKTQVQVDTADDGDEALLLTQDKKYDIIFLDHMMPGKDGIETLHELREHNGNINQNTVAVCLTANAISGSRERYIEEGFSDYLTKPIDSGKLEDMLINYLPKEKIGKAQQVETKPETRSATATVKETDKGNMAGAEAGNTAELSELLAPLQGQDWIDLKLGIQNSGDMEAYLPLLRVFYESLDDRAAEIEGYYEDGNIKDYTTKVHALKSSA
ncbi:MAG: response regulator, partial [Anaerovibrio sp.]|nr:response regulator [Anaerovibrio sp.]